jgi:ribosomal protein S18 acetylase RimI-like enzyme
MSGTIRPAEGRDVPAVAGCVRASYAKYVERIGKEPAPMRQDHAAEIEAGGTYVLVEGEELVGTIQARTEGDHLFVGNVAVRPDRQGEGFGRALMAFAEGRAAREGLAEVRLYTNEKMWENLAFYGRLGFEETHRKLDGGYRRVFLRKRVDTRVGSDIEGETGMRGADDGR